MSFTRIERFPYLQCNLCVILLVPTPNYTPTNPAIKPLTKFLIGGLTMNDNQWEIVAQVYDNVQAEILKGFLEAQGFTVFISREGYQTVFGLTNQALTQIDILVPTDQLEKAAKVLDDYEEGKFFDAQEDQG